MHVLFYKEQIVREHNQDASEPILCLSLQANHRQASAQILSSALDNLLTTFVSLS